MITPPDSWWLGLPYRAEAAFPTGSTLWELESADVDDPNHAAPGRFCDVFRCLMGFLMGLMEVYHDSLSVFMGV